MDEQMWKFFVLFFKILGKSLFKLKFFSKLDCINLDDRAFII